MVRTMRSESIGNISTQVTMRYLLSVLPAFGHDVNTTERMGVLEGVARLHDPEGSELYESVNTNHYTQRDGLV